MIRWEGILDGPRYVVEINYFCTGRTVAFWSLKMAKRKYAEVFREGRCMSVRLVDNFVHDQLPPHKSFDYRWECYAPVRRVIWSSSQMRMPVTDEAGVFLYWQDECMSEPARANSAGDQ